MPQQGEEKRRAFVTFLAGDGDYIKGVIGLSKSLRLVDSRYELIVSVLPDVPRRHTDLLLAHGCNVRSIQPVLPPPGVCAFAMPHYVINYSKLRMWEFEDYDQLLYLDADMMVFENIDELFDLSPPGSFTAVKDCFCEKTWSHTPQFKLGYCQQCPDRVPWNFALGEPPKPYFNAGMFVFEPNSKTFGRMIEALAKNPPTPFAEQDFLNLFFQDAFRPVPNAYNLVLAMLWRHPENVNLAKTKVIHYCATGSKPWAYTGEVANMDRKDVKELVRKWWVVYNTPLSLMDGCGPKDPASVQVLEYCPRQR
ncbi:hypothetical protein SELMODRAFT_124303 [Selaginella moellendorffii]|uniref:Hexosyltransferase n=1 Tax=Selaginella moellendorffii TaxID=88036 RepID=D8ST53_SELML|nr:galactinol synthase 3 [Selaginella moellendorffii]EFJ12427.1 hypothetical protein SELMODRAFT_124303 [Selaginella moellendorffii]|eukprot:XP_002986570.1 galactinol synthase 3 [Selaginella moellendorffii]